MQIKQILINSEEELIKHFGQPSSTEFDITFQTSNYIRHSESENKMSDIPAADQLRAIIERIERLEEEKNAISTDIKEIYAEAKGNGFDTKAIRKIIVIRKQDSNERSEQEAIIDTYLAALGMLPDDDDDRYIG